MVDLAMNNVGIRDTTRGLHISINAVVRTLKNSRREMRQAYRWITCRFNSFVKWTRCGRLSATKKRQRWLWYAWEPRLKWIIAHVFGSRSKKTLRNLLKLLSGFNIAFWCTDSYRAYNDALPEARHITGKLYKLAMLFTLANLFKVDQMLRRQPRSVWNQGTAQN